MIYKEQEFGKNFKRKLKFRINVIASFIVSIFLLAIGGAAVYLCYAFEQTVYIYLGNFKIFKNLVVVGADLLLIIFAIVFITTGIRAYLRNRASNEYEYLKDLFRSETELKYAKKGVKVALKFGNEGEGEYYYVSHKAQYPFIELTKKESEKEKTKETSTLLPQQHPKKERKKSLKYDERSRSKSTSRVAQM